jgi:hydroxymethylpyrimidine pyrophosphatase-like HAD family hydrolase
MIYAIDFDGTLCENRFPDIGPPREHVIEAVKKIKEDGDTLILWTCRCGERLQEAVDFCKHKGLEFDYINENTKENIKQYGNDCRKVYADFYIDDKAYII